jgi:hypothetical protein
MRSGARIAGGRLACTGVFRLNPEADLSIFEGRQKLNTAYKPFPLGRIVATPGVIEAVPNHCILQCLQLHATGEWGEVPPEDARENDYSTHNGLRILSSYFIDPDLPSQSKFWIITEADRSSTCVLLRSEY